MGQCKLTDGSRMNSSPSMQMVREKSADQINQIRACKTGFILIQNLSTLPIQLPVSNL